METCNTENALHSTGDDFFLKCALHYHTASQDKLRL